MRLSNLGEVPESYKEGLQKAIDIFNHQMVFDTMERKMVPLKPRQPSDLDSYMFMTSTQHCGPYPFKL